MSSIPLHLFLERILASLGFLSGLVGVILLLLLTAFVFVITDWRITVLGIGAQSFLLAALASRHSPVEWALLRAVTGGLIAIMWCLSARTVRWGSHPIWWLRWRWPPLSARGLLRTVMVVFVAILLFSHQVRLPLYGLEPDLALLCTWLMVMGTLALALSGEVLTAGIGLLWWLEAFHLYYSVLEHNVIIEGVAGGMKLLIGLACAFLIVAEGVPSQIPQGERR